MGRIIFLDRMELEKFKPFQFKFLTSTSCLLSILDEKNSLDTIKDKKENIRVFIRAIIMNKNLVDPSVSESEYCKYCETIQNIYQKL